MFKDKITHNIFETINRRTQTYMDILLIDIRNLQRHTYDEELKSFQSKLLRLIKAASCVTNENLHTDFQLRTIDQKKINQ